MHPQIAALEAKIAATIDGATAQGRDLLASESRAIARDTAVIADLDAADAARNAADIRRARYADIIEPTTERSGVRIGHEPTTYERGSGQSYFADLIRSTRDGDIDSNDRLRRHSAEVKVGAESRTRQGREEFRDLTRVDGAGGQFVPPMYLVDEYVALARAGRPTADLLDRRPLPPGTDSLNIPSISTGSAAAVQAADNAAVQETDLTDANIVAPVRSLAGQVDVALQLLEQSPVAFDDVIFRDLLGDLNTKLDVQVLSGSGVSGQLTGLRTVAGINSVVYTDATPTLAEAYPKIADAIQQISGNIFAPPTAILLHPRRWGWMTAALDTQNRPLVVPTAGSAMNAAASMEGDNAEGRVGQLQGIPVYVDASIPTNLGGGTEDVIIIVRASESMLWESVPKMRVLPDVGSGTLTTRIQVYSWVAMATRRPKSISTITGTGLIAPVFA